MRTTREVRKEGKRALAVLSGGRLMIFCLGAICSDFRRILFNLHQDLSIPF